MESLHLPEESTDTQDSTGLLIQVLVWMVEEEEEEEEEEYVFQSFNSLFHDFICVLKFQFIDSRIRTT